VGKAFGTGYRLAVPPASELHVITEEGKYLVIDGNPGDDPSPMIPYF
jgi:hypothetical protein